MSAPCDSRAVSALFRVFGGGEVAAVVEAGERADWRGMDLREHQIFSILVPFTVFVASATWLGAAVGGVSGWLLAIPTSFILLNLLPLVLQLKSPLTQWQGWSVSCLIWAIYHCEGNGLAAFIAYLWIGIMTMDLAANCILGSRAMMALPGVAGMVWRIVLVISLHGLALALGMKFGWVWGIMAAATLAAAGCWAVLNPGCTWLGPVTRTTAGEGILITIDDGPDLHDTPLILDLLDRYQTKALFFMIGEKVCAHPELACEVLRRGHEIGNHTHTHPQASFWCASPWRTWWEIKNCQDTIHRATGEKPRWFRAPVGHRNLFTHPATRAHGLQVMAWNRRGYDAVETDVAKVLAKISAGLTPGDIILLHEATPIAVEVLTEVLAAISNCLANPTVRKI